MAHVIDSLKTRVHEMSDLISDYREGYMAEDRFVEQVDHINFKMGLDFRRLNDKDDLYDVINYLLKELKGK